MLPKAFLLSLLICSVSSAQDRLPTMPRYDRYEKMRREIGGSVVRGELSGVAWSLDSKSFFFTLDLKTFKYDIAKRKAAETEEKPPEAQSSTRRQARGRGNPERGRQFDTVFSEDGKLKAFHRNRNVYVSDADGKNEVAVTSDGNEGARTKYGIASWVYGEELNVREAMWFSPDAKKLAFYRFDESKVPDFYLTLDQGKIQDRLDVEAYPKAGAPNPVVDLFIYDLKDRTTKQVDVRFDGGGGADLGYYVYDVRWSPDGNELWFNRTTRKQNVMELCAADPGTGKCRVIVREKSDKGWTENHPQMTLLAPPAKGPRRFLWMSERNGFRNLYLYDLSGKLINAVTRGQFEVANIVRVDEDAGTVYYMARDGSDPYRLQLHMVGLDGKGEKRLTEPAFHHSVNISPDGKYFIDTVETIDMPPVTKLIEASNGKAVDILATSDTTKFDELRLRKTERFKFTAADGKTTCYGYLMKPSDFDPAKKYPLLVSVYGGPGSGGGSDRFTLPNPISEMGFLVAWIDGRGTSGRGAAHEREVYEKLGVVEIDDQAAGVNELTKRPYVDGRRVGIYGTSYGGYATIMAMLRYPDVFQVGVAGSPVTDWRNYDTIYTERYMGLPDESENKKGYDAGSAMTYAKDLKGRLLLYYGTADNNVHPTNTLQLILALDRYGKSYDVSVGPDRGHSGPNQNRMWEYFVQYLILGAEPKPLKAVWKRPR